MYINLEVNGGYYSIHKMRRFSIRYKTGLSDDFRELMFFATKNENEYDFFTYQQLEKLLKDSMYVDISQDVYLSSEEIVLLNRILYLEIEKLLNQKNNLQGQYPSHVVRNLDVVILEKEYALNIRNQWHQYIIDLHEMYTAFNKVKNGGEVWFAHLFND